MGTDVRRKLTNTDVFASPGFLFCFNFHLDVLLIYKFLPNSI